MSVTEKRFFSLTLKPCSRSKMGKIQVFSIVPNQERTEDFIKTERVEDFRKKTNQSNLDVLKFVSLTFCL